MDERGVVIKCKRCGQDAYSGEFVLDADYGMVVCPMCIKMKQGQPQGVTNTPDELPEEKEEKKEEEYPEAKPAGYDSEDEYLERVAAKKETENNMIQVNSFGKIKCRKCSYPFKYDAELQKPRICPYCGLPVGADPYKPE